MKQNKENEIVYKENFKEKVWNVILKNNETDFQEAFSGFRGNKSKFFNEVISRFNQSHSSCENRESLQKRSNTFFSKKTEKINTIDICICDLVSKLDFIEKDDIWKKVVVANKDVPISKLINSFDNADWVNMGRTYINESNVCTFCQ